MTTHPLPYLPGTQIQFAWDSTSLGYLKTCPRLYKFVMLEGWSPKYTSEHLRFGIEIHQALQDYDELKCEGASHKDALHQAVQQCLLRIADWSPDPTTKAGKYKNKLSLIRAIIDYLDHYERDPAETFILSDGTPAVELSFRFELDYGPAAGVPYMISGHLDRVVEFAGDLFVMDRKTTTSTPGPYYFKQYEPNNQMTLYTVASQIILNSPVKGVIIDAIQILVDSTKFERGITYRTKDQLDEWLTELRGWFELALAYATTDFWPANDTACDKFGGCKFRDICAKSPSVRQTFLESDFIQLPENERWNPLKPR